MYDMRGQNDMINLNMEKTKKISQSYNTGNIVAAYPVLYHRGNNDYINSCCEIGTI